MYQVGADERYVKHDGLYAEPTPTTLIIEIFPSTKITSLGILAPFLAGRRSAGKFPRIASGI
jgi:hypothetical protein